MGKTYITKIKALSDNLTIDDMGMLICKDVGCELTYCQATISDPYNRPFNNCDQLFKNLNQCIANQINNYQQNNLGKTMQEYAIYMIDKKKAEKHTYTFLEDNKNIQITESDIP